MSWSSLPDDVVHVILAKLCLIELACIATTCSTFRAAYCRRLTQEQEARRQLAVNTFGTEGIACLLDLIARLLNSEPLPPGFINEDWNRFQICSDKVVHDSYLSASPDTSEGGDIPVDLRREVRLEESCICVKAHNGRGSMTVSIPRGYVSIEAFPTHVEDLVPVALVQALLSEGLTKVICRDGRLALIEIQRPVVATGFTQAGLKARIMPLLPFASLRTPCRYGETWRRGRGRSQMRGRAWGRFTRVVLGSR